MLVAPVVQSFTLAPVNVQVSRPHMPCVRVMAAPGGFVPPPSKEGDYVDIFCRAINGAMEQTVITESIKQYVQPRDATPQGLTKEDQAWRSGFGPNFWKTVKSPPEMPGLARPVWLTIAASVPTALGWYGYYKFSVEEELFYDELRREGRTSGFGGYGTLILFSWCLIFGTLGSLVGVPHADILVEFGAVWILLSQVNLYKRVNELLTEQSAGAQRLDEPPLYAWWALLPPPLDVVVGLRQLHFLAQYWTAVRGDEWAGDPVAEEYFPFISAERFTLKKFFRTPSMWFWFTKDVKDFELDFLKED